MQPIRSVYQVNSSEHVFDILVRELYKDTIMTVPRETIQNAADAIVEAGYSSGTIYITIPGLTVQHPVYVVKDTGIGLTRDEYESIYAQFFKSTKDKLSDLLNETRTAGYYGLGSKSPWILTDVFEVETIKNGKAWRFKQYKKGFRYELIEERDELAELTGLELIVPIDLTKLVREFTNRTGATKRIFDIIAHEVADQLSDKQLALIAFRFWCFYYALSAILTPYTNIDVYITDQDNLSAPIHLNSLLRKSGIIITQTNRLIAIEQQYSKQLLQLLLRLAGLSTAHIAQLHKLNNPFQVQVNTLLYPKIQIEKDGYPVSVSNYFISADKHTKLLLIPVLQKNEIRITPDREQASVDASTFEIFEYSPLYLKHVFEFSDTVKFELEDYGIEFVRAKVKYALEREQLELDDQLIDKILSQQLIIVENEQLKRVLDDWELLKQHNVEVIAEELLLSLLENLKVGALVSVIDKEGKFHRFYTPPRLSPIVPQIAERLQATYDELADKPVEAVIQIDPTIELPAFNVTPTEIEFTTITVAEALKRNPKTLYAFNALYKPNWFKVTGYSIPLHPVITSWWILQAEAIRQSKPIIVLIDLEQFSSAKLPMEYQQVWEQLIRHIPTDHRLYISTSRRSAIDNPVGEIRSLLSTGTVDYTIDYSIKGDIRLFKDWIYDQWLEQGRPTDITAFHNSILNKARRQIEAIENEIEELIARNLEERYKKPFIYFTAYLFERLFSVSESYFSNRKLIELYRMSKHSPLNKTVPSPAIDRQLMKPRVIKLRKALPPIQTPLIQLYGILEAVRNQF